MPLPQLPGWAVLGPDSHPWGPNAGSGQGAHSQLGALLWGLLKGCGAGSIWSSVPKNLGHPPLGSSWPPLFALLGWAICTGLDTSSPLRSAGALVNLQPGKGPAGTSLLPTVFLSNPGPVAFQKALNAPHETPGTARYPSSHLPSPMATTQGWGPASPRLPSTACI